jgi:hypothetical protein
LRSVSIWSTALARQSAIILRSRIGHADALLIEILADLDEHVLVAPGCKVGLSHRLCSPRRRPHETELAGSPLAKKLSAPLLGLELELLIESELL